MVSCASQAIELGRMDGELGRVITRVSHQDNNVVIALIHLWNCECHITICHLEVLGQRVSKVLVRRSLLNMAKADLTSQIPKLARHVARIPSNIDTLAHSPFSLAIRVENLRVIYKTRIQRLRAICQGRHCSRHKGNKRQSRREDVHHVTEYVRVCCEVATWPYMYQSGATATVVPK